MMLAVEIWRNFHLATTIIYALWLILFEDSLDMTISIIMRCDPQIIIVMARNYLLICKSIQIYVHSYLK